MTLRNAARTLLLSCLVISLGLAGCGTGRESRLVPLTREADPAGTQPGPVPPRTLRVAVASVLTPPSTLPHYGRLIEYLGQRLGVPTEMIRREAYSETNELMRNRYCQVSFMCNYAFLRAREEFGARLLAVPILGGRPDYQSYVIVARDAPYRSLADLAGRRFAFADPLCNAGWLYPRYRLRQLGIPVEGYFGREEFTYDYVRSIQAVANGLADAAAVESPLYDWLISRGDPDAARTRIVDRSPPFGNPPVAIHPALDHRLEARLRELLLSLQDHKQGRELLSGIMTERFVDPDGALYAPVQQMRETLEQP